MYAQRVDPSCSIPCLTDHPDALPNRRDLRLINRIMRSAAWFAARSPPPRPGDRVLEIGVGWASWRSA